MMHIKSWTKIATAAVLIAGTTCTVPSAQAAPTYSISDQFLFSAPALPDYVIAGYWKKWGSTNPVRLRDADPRYNVVFLAFAEGRPDGSLHFGQDVQSEESFIDDVRLLRSRGVRVIMSIGGQYSKVNVNTDTQKKNFLQSMRGFREKYGINGIDWDIEGQEMHIKNMEEISRELKGEFGENFAVTLTPQGHKYDYKELARNLADQLDMVSIMFYDYPERTPEDRTRSVIRRTNEFVNDFGLSPRQIGVGMRVTDNSGEYYADNNVMGFSLRGTKHTLEELGKRYDYRGAFIWAMSYEERAGKKWLDIVEGQQQPRLCPACAPAEGDD